MCIICELQENKAVLTQVLQRLDADRQKDTSLYHYVEKERKKIQDKLKKLIQPLAIDMIFYPYYNDPSKGDRN
jgi:ribosome assembly protein YihI (activator of Der GTPase)